MGDVVEKKFEYNYVWCKPYARNPVTGEDAFSEMERENKLTDPHQLQLGETGSYEYDIPPTQDEVDTFETIEAFSDWHKEWVCEEGKYVRKHWLYPDGSEGDGGYGEYTKWRHLTNKS